MHQYQVPLVDHLSTLMGKFSIHLDETVFNQRLQACARVVRQAGHQEFIQARAATPFEPKA